MTGATMSQSEFERSLKAVLVHEGGYANHPADPGGATMKGVTQRVYDAFRRRRRLEVQNVREISEIEIQMIYRVQYWNEIRGDDLPAGVGYAVFDAAVNSGPRRAVVWLQRALGANLVDGQLGEATLALVANHPDHDRLIADMLALRLAFMKALKTWKHFGRGWNARVADVQKRGQAWATGSVGAAPVFIPAANAKASEKDAKRPPSTVAGDLSTGAGAAAAGAGGVLREAQQTLEPLAGSSEWVATAVAVLALGGLAMAIGGLAFRQFQAWRAARLQEALK